MILPPEVEVRLQEALNVALGVVIETESVAHHPTPAPAPTLAPEDGELPDPHTEKVLDLLPFLSPVVPPAHPPTAGSRRGLGLLPI